MGQEKPLVIVLSRNYSTGLGIIRSLGAAGYTVDLIASVKRKGSSVIASSSKYVRNSVEVMFSALQEDDGEGILREILKYRKQEGEKILFPADDYTMSVMDRNRELLRGDFIMPHTSGERSVLELMDKTVQSELAKGAGIAVPAEWMISLRSEIEIPEAVIYPCFVKPIESVSGYKTEMAVCEDRNALESHLLGMQRFYRERSVLVQEYLEIEKEYDFSGLCLDDRIIIPGVIEKIHIAEHERGVTMAGRMLAPEVLGDVLAQAKRMLREFHYTGMFDMEFNLSRGTLYFNEVNLRSGGPNYSYYLNGANLPAVLVKELTGEIYDEADTEIECFGKSFVYERMAWEDYIYGFMTKQEMESCIAEADYRLLADDSDPQPGKVFSRRIRLSSLKHRVKGTLGRP